MRLVGGDDGEHRIGACHRLGRGRSAKHLRCRIVGSLRRPHSGIGRIRSCFVPAQMRALKSGLPYHQERRAASPKPRKAIEPELILEFGMGSLGA